MLRRVGPLLQAATGLEYRFSRGPTVSLAAGMVFFTMGQVFPLPMARLQVGHAF